MATVNFTNPRARFLDENGNPLSGGRVFFYEAGTSTPKTVYSDYKGTIPADNPLSLDAEGYVSPATGIRLGTGLYDIRVQRLTAPSTWADYFTYPDVAGSGLADAGSLVSMGIINTIQELRDLEAGAYDIVYVLGYYTANDGGARYMKWNGASTSPENGGTYIVPAGTPAIGRWDWLPMSDEVVTPQLFGAFPSDGSLVVGSQIDFMISYCLASSKYKTIHFNLGGDYHLNSSSSFTSDLSVIVGPDVKFRNNAGTASITFSCEHLEIQGSDQQIVFPSAIAPSMDMYIDVSRPIEVSPEWWGAEQGFSDDTFTFNRVLTSVNARHPLRLRAVYDLGLGLVDFSTHKLIFEQGAGFNCEGADITIGEFENNSTTYLFTGPNINQVYFTYPEAESVWFNWTTATVANAGFMVPFINLNTASGARYFKWIVTGTVRLTDSITYTSMGNNHNHLKFMWSFPRNCSLSLFDGNVKVEFGYVEAGSYKIFNVVANNDFNMRFMEDVNPEWWGAAIARDSNLNADSLRACFSHVMASNDNTLNTLTAAVAADFKGKRLSSTAITVGANSDIRQLHLKNGGITFDSADAGPYLLTVEQGITLNNFYMTSANASASLIFVDTTSSSADITISDSYLSCSNRALLSTSEGRLIIKDSEIVSSDNDTNEIPLVAHTGDDSLVVGNVMTRTLFPINQECYLHMAGENAIVKNNTFSGISPVVTGSCVVSDNKVTNAIIRCDNPAATRVIGNEFVSGVRYGYPGIVFNATTVDFVVKGLVCTHNIFRVGAGGYSGGYAINKTGTFAAQGHRADVYDNYGDDFYFGVTRLKGKVYVETLSSSSTFTLDMGFPQNPFRNGFIFSYVAEKFTGVTYGMSIGGIIPLAYTIYGQVTAVFDRRANEDVVITLDNPSETQIKGDFHFELESTNSHFTDFDNP